jgi:hypothetical protein
MAGPDYVHLGPTGRECVFFLMLFLIPFAFAVGWWLRNPATSPWTQGRWKVAVPLVTVVALSTWVFWLESDPLMLMVAFFMPHISLGIPVAVAIVLAVLCWLDPAFKALWKWYGLILLTILGATLAMGPMTMVLANLPPREECRFKVTVAVDTPEGERSVSGVYQIMTNRVDILGRMMTNRQSLAGKDFVLDLGGRGRVEVSLPDHRNGAFFHYPMEAFGRLKYMRGETGGRVELLGKLRPEFTGVRGGEAKVLRPEDFEAFFGSGVRFRRVWLEMLD